MTESEQYYYDKGRHEGFIEGTIQGTKAITDFVSKSLTPISILIPKTDENIKLLKELKS